MKALLLGRRSLLAYALSLEMTKRGMPFEWLSYQEIAAALKHPLHPSFSHVFNCIAYTNVDKAEEEVEEAYEINSHFPLQLAKATKVASCKLIHYSTDYVFDGNSKDMYNEESTTSPLNVYGKSKLEGEKSVLETDKEALIIRTSWIYGMGKQNFVETILRKMMDQEEVKVASDQFNKSTSSLDLAEGTMRLLENSGLFHFANEGVISRFTFATSIQTIAKELGFPLKCEKLTPVSSSEFKAKAKRPLFSALATGKYQKASRCMPRFYEEPLSEYLGMLKGSSICL